MKRLNKNDILGFKQATAKNIAMKKRNAIILMLAAKVESTTELDIKQMYPNLEDKLIKKMLYKIKTKRKELANATGYLDVKGIQNFKDKGYVYLIENPLYAGWVKCGMTTNLTRRLSAYNAYDPFGRFAFLATKKVADRKKCEIILIEKLGVSAEKVIKNEWFKIDAKIAKTIFTQI